MCSGPMRTEDLCNDTREVDNTSNVNAESMSVPVPNDF